MYRLARRLPAPRHGLPSAQHPTATRTGAVRFPARTHAAPAQCDKNEKTTLKACSENPFKCRNRRKKALINFGFGILTLLIKALKTETIILVGWPSWPLAAKAAEASPAATALPPTAKTEAKSDWWSFKPASRPPLPSVRNERWARNPVDLFILARLEQQKRAPSPEADLRTLIRRLSFDLTGLPPSPEEVEQFSADGSPQAYEILVDRLLASPRYGK